MLGGGSKFHKKAKKLDFWTLLDPFQDFLLKTVFGIDDLWKQKSQNVGIPFIGEIFLTFGNEL